MIGNVLYMSIVIKFFWLLVCYDLFCVNDWIGFVCVLICCCVVFEFLLLLILVICFACIFLLFLFTIVFEFLCCVARKKKKGLLCFWYVCMCVCLWVVNK